MQNTLALYVIDSDTKEAESVLWFCSEECRQVIKENTEHTVKLGTNDDWIDGTVCDECGKELAA